MVQTLGTITDHEGAKIYGQFLIVKFSGDYTATQLLIPKQIPEEWLKRWLPPGLVWFRGWGVLLQTKGLPVQFWSGYMPGFQTRSPVGGM